MAGTLYAALVMHSYVMSLICCAAQVRRCLSLVCNAHECRRSQSLADMHQPYASAEKAVGHRAT